jgi:hypothetical protein
MADRDRKPSRHEKFREAAKRVTLPKQKLRPSKLLTRSAKVRSPISKEELLATNWQGKILAFLHREQTTDNFDTLNEVISQTEHADTVLTKTQIELEAQIKRLSRDLDAPFHSVEEHRHKKGRVKLLQRELESNYKKIQMNHQTISTLRHKLQLSHQQIDAFRGILRILLADDDSFQISDKELSQTGDAYQILNKQFLTTPPLAFVIWGAINVSNNIKTKISSLEDIQIGLDLTGKRHDQSVAITTYIQELIRLDQSITRLVESYFTLKKLPEELRNYRYSLEKYQLQRQMQRNAFPAAQKIQSVYRQHQSQKIADKKRSAKRGRDQVAVASRALIASSKLRKKLRQKRRRDAEKLYRQLSEAATTIQSKTRQLRAQKDTHKRRTAKQARQAVHRATRRLRASQVFSQAGESLRNRWRSIKRATEILTTANLLQLIKILQSVKRGESEARIIPAHKIDLEGFLSDVLIPLGYVKDTDGNLVRGEKPQLINRTIDRTRKLLIDRLDPTPEDVTKIKQILSHLSKNPDLRGVNSNRLTEKVRRSLKILGFRKDPEDQNRLLRSNLDKGFTHFLINQWQL